jgi:Mat/Ecp fimbriae periplasmic chaperone
MTLRAFLVRAVLCCAAAAGANSAAHAELVLSQVIVDFLPGKPMREDIEVWNSGSERMYVSAEPFEIVAAGTPQERRVAVALAENSGLLVSPQRLVLEPGERRIVRVAATGARPPSDIVYRLAVKPVAGAISAETDALKVLVGYDALVLVRPETVTGTGTVDARRSGRTLTLTNTGNTAQELFDGRQCDAGGGNCQALPAKRLYPGAAWEQELPYDTEVSYKTAIGPTVRERTF